MYIVELEIDVNCQIRDRCKLSN